MGLESEADRREPVRSIFMGPGLGPGPAENNAISLELFLPQWKAVAGTPSREREEHSPPYFSCAVTCLAFFVFSSTSQHLGWPGPYRAPKHTRAAQDGCRKPLEPLCGGPEEPTL